MQFGYFTLSDNRYPNNPRSAESFIKDIYAEALWARVASMSDGDEESLWERMNHRITDAQRLAALDA